MHHLEFLIYFGRNSGEENLFLASSISQEIDAKIQLNWKRYSIYSAYL